MRTKSPPKPGAAPLLPTELERILYLDVDTIVINSLAELAVLPFDGTYFMACTHVRKVLTKLNQTRLGMEQEAPYINSGVMLLNLPLFREHLDLSEISAFASKYVSYKDLKALMTDLKTVCAAVDEQAALDALDTFSERWDKKLSSKCCPSNSPLLYSVPVRIIVLRGEMSRDGTGRREPPKIPAPPPR